MIGRLRLVALTLLILASGNHAWAQDYPSRTVRLVVAFPAGGPTDFVARVLADKLKALLGQSVIIENKPGANAAIGAEYVAKSDPDGHTLFFTTAGAVVINPHMRADLPYDPVNDFAPVTLVVNTMEVLVVRTDTPINRRASWSRWRSRAPTASRWRRPASAARRISRSSCSRARPARTCCTSPIAAAGQREKRRDINWLQDWGRVQVGSSKRCRCESANNGYWSPFDAHWSLWKIAVVGFHIMPNEQFCSDF